MNLRDLHYLRTLAKVKNFKRAAERCFISQPTLSMQIKKLEEELGVVLFERDKRFVQVTSAGHQAVAYANQILQLTNDLKQSVKQFHDPYAGNFKLGIFPTLAPYLLPKIVGKISRTFPNLNLQLHEKITDQCIENLLVGELDVIIIASEAHSEKLHHIDLFTESFYLVCPKKHPLTQYQTVRADRLPENELLLLTEGHCLREQGLEYCKRVGKNHHTAFAATSLNTVLAMVGLGKGISFIPSLAKSITRQHPVALKSFTSKPPCRTVTLYWRKSLQRQKLFRQLASLIQSAVTGIEGIKVLGGKSKKTS